METTIRGAAQAILKVLGPNGKNWTKSVFATVENGKSCYCVEGARRKCVIDKTISTEVGQRIRNRMDILVANMGALGLYSWNDAPERTFKDVQKLLRSIAYGKRYKP